MQILCAPLLLMPAVHVLLHLLLIIAQTEQLHFEESETNLDLDESPAVTRHFERNDADNADNADSSRWHRRHPTHFADKLDTFANNLDNSAQNERKPYDGTSFTKFANDEVNEHELSREFFENLDIEDLEKLSNNNRDNEDNSDGDKDYKESGEENGLRSRNNRNRLTHSAELLEHLIELYKLKSGNAFAKRGDGPQLSIVNPLDVLRQRLLLELARRRMKENQDQINANAEILKKIGKRRRRSTPLSNQISLIHTSADIHNNSSNKSHLNKLNNKLLTTKFLYESRSKFLNRQKVRRKRKERVKPGMS